MNERNFATEMNKNARAMRANNADRIGIFCIVRILCGVVTTHLPLRIDPCAENQNRLANVKNREQCIRKGRAWGLTLRIEKIHVVDREGLTGRRNAELRLVECFSGRGVQYRAMA